MITRAIGSGHGPDGVFIDRSTTPATIYVAEAKSSVNGVGSAAAPTGTAQQRINTWRNDFQGPRHRNVDAETRSATDEINDLYLSESQPVVKGIWVQVEVPPLNASNLYPLGGKLSAWLY